MNAERDTTHITLGERIILGAIVLLFVVLSCVGITWGLPSRSIDKFLFGDEVPWSGEKIYRLAGAAGKFSPTRGADVDVDPLDRGGDEPINLTATDEDVARIYLRYRLYTYQPDEMITMMALAGMSPSRLDFDPRLYQYGGLFIYPVGALIRLCGAVGLIDVRSDVVYYLDNPGEFGKFYVVARAYSAAWGALGVILVFAIARRLGGRRAALIAALLFTLMPVVVCMAHEGKPHLPGAVLMLAAVWFGMRQLGAERDQGNEGSREQGEEGRRDGGEQIRARSASDGSSRAADFSPRGVSDSSNRNFWFMCICCGAAFGMVLSSLPIFGLIPLVAFLGRYGWGDAGERHLPDGVMDDQSGPLPHGRGSVPLPPSPSAPSPLRPSAALTPRGLKPAARAEEDVSCGRLLDWWQWFKITTAGVLLGALVYLVTNPYIVINAFTNREVLRSNFSNSLAMYDISRIGEGFVRVLELTTEGATLPLLILGTLALIVAIWKHRKEMLPLAVPALVLFVQFVLIGAGKPAEYGRFGVFTNTALAIGTACMLGRRWTTKLRDVVNWMPVFAIVPWVATFGTLYLHGFMMDAGNNNTRKKLAGIMVNDQYRTQFSDVAVTQEPAPYCCPPLPFAKHSVLLYQSAADAALRLRMKHPATTVIIEPSDLAHTRIEYPDGQEARIVELPDALQGVLDTRLHRIRLDDALLREKLIRPHQQVHGVVTPISWANKPLTVCGRIVPESNIRNRPTERRTGQPPHPPPPAS